MTAAAAKTPKGVIKDKIAIGTDAVTGKPLFLFQTAPDKAAVVVGPFVHGTVEIHDGTVYDVNDVVIEADSEEHAGAISHAVGVKLETEGHPAHDAENPFYHLCTDHCGPDARDASHPSQQAALRELVKQIIKAPAPHAPSHFYITEASSVDQLKTEAQALIKSMQERVAAWAAAPKTAAEAYRALNMSRASSAAENAALNGLSGTGNTNVMPDTSLHTGDPSTTGANENANSGSYARQASSWNTASGGNMTNNGALTFTTGGSVAVSFFGTWSSATYGAGTYAIGGTLNAAVTSTSITIASGALTFSAS
jgi:hypothetical protein